MPVPLSKLNYPHQGCQAVESYQHDFASIVFIELFVLCATQKVMSCFSPTPEFA